MIYPQTPAPINTITLSLGFDTVSTTLTDNVAQGRLRQFKPKRGFDIQYATKDIEPIETFYKDTFGLHSFTFIRPHKSIFKREFVSKVTSPSTVFDLPCCQATEIVVTVGGIVLDFGILPGAGRDGRDRAVFTAPVAVDSIVRVDFKGLLVCDCKFIGDMSSALLPLSYTASVRLETI